MTDSTPTRGDAFRARMHADFELGPAEVELVEEAARSLDTLDLINELVKRDPSPANLKEARLQRAAVSALLVALRIPDEEERRAESRSEQARRAARARWDRAGA